MDSQKYSIEDLIKFYDGNQSRKEEYVFFEKGLLGLGYAYLRYEYEDTSVKGARLYKLEGSLLFAGGVELESPFKEYGFVEYVNPKQISKPELESKRWSLVHVKDARKFFSNKKKEQAFQDLVLDVKHEIEYKPGWTFHVREKDYPYLQVVFKDHKGKEQKGRKWVLSKHMCKSELVQTVFKAFLTAEEHEAREFFKYKGSSIFSPHYNVDKLVGLHQQENWSEHRKEN